jgi:hypothetical protein
MPKSLATALTVFVLLACGCRSNDTPRAQNAPAEIARPAPAPTEGAAATPETDLAKVRQAARDFVKEMYPGSRAEGVFTLPYIRGNLYLAGVDLSLGSQRRTADLLVRLYVRENGSQYWRAESLDRGLATLLPHRSFVEDGRID